MVKQISDILRDVTHDKKYEEAKNLDLMLTAINDYIMSKSKDLGFSTANGINAIKFMHLQYTNNAFKAIVDDYNVGNLSDSLFRMRFLLFGFDKNTLQLNMESMKKGLVTYRVRRQDDYSILEQKRLFHMPFDKINNLKISRYGINGFPCLYLGYSLYDSWEETRRPDIERYNYIAFKNKDELKMLVVDCPDNLNSYQRMVQFFIFALCSSYVKPNADENMFKFQYVVPQLVLQSLIGYNRSKSDVKDRIDGIRYVSARLFRDDEQFRGVRKLFYNYVIPIVKYSEKGYDEYLNEKFLVSPVHAIYQDKLTMAKFKFPKTRVNNYVNSLYGNLEQEIKKEKFVKMSIKEF